MSTMETCQIAEYVKAIEAEDRGACSNFAASHTIGLTIGTLTFFYKLCPGCYSWVLKAAKVQEACTQKMMYQSITTDNDTYEKLLHKLRQKLGYHA